MHKIYLYTDQATSGLLSGFCLDESATTETVLTHSDVKKILLAGECDSRAIVVLAVSPHLLTASKLIDAVRNTSLHNLLIIIRINIFIYFKLLFS
jgi:hypothetical protein